MTGGLPCGASGGSTRLLDRSLLFPALECRLCPRTATARRWHACAAHEQAKILQFARRPCSIRLWCLEVHQALSVPHTRSPVWVEEDRTEPHTWPRLDDLDVADDRLGNTYPLDRSVLQRNFGTSEDFQDTVRLDGADYIEQNQALARAINTDLHRAGLAGRVRQVSLIRRRAARRRHYQTIPTPKRWRISSAT